MFFVLFLLVLMIMLSPLPAVALFNGVVAILVVAAMIGFGIWCVVGIARDRQMYAEGFSAKPSA